ncbi:hypothetical protein EST38_g2540 [Candolleomyces aberdarensis]|uniref:Uncharacterized protein n=1 Tax=Candolleomyces aberdarensis TaxID=2316362 RepID=A0A4Q2DST0_9AGAR|nr:hypothetical protein EST38_g2540 [Candolleomyces aberdarensis]
MGANSSTLSDAKGKKTEYRYLKDIVLEHTDEDTEGKHQPLNMAELAILGLKDWPGGYSLPLVKVSPKQWKVEGALVVKLPNGVIEVEVIARSEEGKDIGSLHLNTSTMQTIALGSEGGKPAQNQRMETADEELHLTLLWHICEIPEPVETLEELTTMLNGLEDLLNNKLFGNIDLARLFNALGVSFMLCFGKTRKISYIGRTSLTGLMILEPH